MIAERESGRSTFATSKSADRNTYAAAKPDGYGSQYWRFIICKRVKKQTEKEKERERENRLIYLHNGQTLRAQLLENP